jgi:hypothetical protein
MAVLWPRPAVLAPAASATNVIQPSDAAVIPLVVKGAAAQSASLQEWQNSSGTVLSKVASDGTVTATSNTSLGTRLTLGDTGARLLMREASSAPTGNADYATIYAIDNGAGKTQLMVIFGTGAAVTIATEP